MSRQRPSRSVCKRCQQEVVWFATRERGTPIAVDPSPDPDEGTVVVTAHGETAEPGRKPRAVSYVDVLSGPVLLEAQSQGETLFMLHIKTCPASKPFNPKPAHVKLDLPQRSRGRPR